MRTPHVILLVAGLGSRLGTSHPKCLSPLGNGETILSRQVRLLRALDLNITAVVGFKKDLIIEAEPDLLFAYNPNYDRTNTAKSLLAGLRGIRGQDVLWLNGDVVFEEGVLQRVLEEGTSTVAVNNARVAEEEVKYTLDADGFIAEISKSVRDPLGEAVGINLVMSEVLDGFRDALDRVGDQDYFEKAMELLIAEQGPVFRAVDVGEHGCIEVDFAEDLEVARSMMGGATSPPSDQ